MRRLEPCSLDEIPENVKFIERTDFSHPLLERISERFFQGETKNSKFFFLEKELDLLEKFAWFLDGTFSLIRNSIHGQIYIISILLSENDKTYAYPVVFIFMEKRETIFYKEIFEFINQKFKETFDRELKPISFHLDCEMACIKAIKHCYTEPTIRLCIFHILKNWRKKFEECVGKTNFSGNKHFQNCWTILRGIFFMPITAIPLIANYFLNTVTPALKNKILEQKFSNFVKKYLMKNYFSNSALFNPNFWSYYYDINILAKFDTTTNTSETINKRLKVLTGTGFLPFKRACQKLHTFKINYLVDYETKVRNDNLNSRRRRTINRENVLLGLVHKYHNFNFMEQSDLNTNVNHCFQLGSVNPESQLVQAPEFFEPSEAISV